MSIEPLAPRSLPAPLCRAVLLLLFRTFVVTRTALSSCSGGLAALFFGIGFGVWLIGVVSLPAFG